MALTDILKVIPIAALLVFLAFSLCAPWYCILENPSKTGTFIETVTVLSMLGIAVYYISARYRSTYQAQRTPKRYKKGITTQTDSIEKIVAIVIAILIVISVIAYVILV